LTLETKKRGKMNKFDEYGIPIAWKREPVDEMMMKHYHQYWSVFDSWCKAQKLRALPAIPHTVATFFTDSSFTSDESQFVWEAINLYHSAHYWNSNVNPIDVLEHVYGIKINNEGEIVIPHNILDEIKTFPSIEELVKRFHQLD